ncbi:hypothetical protein M5D96_009130 [Drosophila gunungcola]|uniref:Uncharacterized protein n=1 Tax=Drosophila gunungcola TaxID=103775 RepID=A0A9Q0BNM0_9MUSC|nr:hypothetical protein M5D96_009130 [Drosophila gunungcola]
MSKGNSRLPRHHSLCQFHHLTVLHDQLFPVTDALVQLHLLLLEEFQSIALLAERFPQVVKFCLTILQVFLELVDGHLAIPRIVFHTVRLLPALLQLLALGLDLGCQRVL